MNITSKDNMTSLQKQLFELRDEKYAAFQSKLTPGIDPKLFIGIRVPVLRKFAKEYMKDAGCKKFLNSLPHKYYDENMLHGIILSEMKDYEDTLSYVNTFLPYVDNWAVCDIMSPKCFKKNKEALLKEIKKWAKSKEVYTCRFGVEMLMSYFLDDDFKEEYLKIPAAIKSEEYYVNMMIAWFFATALTKQWDAALLYIKDSKLDVWTHNKTIQKARESYRITPEQKELLSSMKK